MLTITSPAPTPVSGKPDGPLFQGVPELMRQYVEWGDMAGAVTLVAQEGEVLAFDAVGYADLAERTLMRRDTLFWVASMTKPMTAAAVLALVGEGRLALSDPVEKYLPAFKDLWMMRESGEARRVLGRPGRSITVRDLLTHTHGLDEPPLPEPGTPLAEHVATIARGFLHFEPGTQWRYGNAGMNTLGRLVEVVSGRLFQDFLRERFFGPLGMSRSTFHPEEAELEAMAKSYRRPPIWGPLEECAITLLNGDFRRKEQTVLPGAGLFSTAEEIFKFYQMLLDGGEAGGRRYLPEELAREMVSSQTGDFEAGFSAGMGWGLGVGVVRQPGGWTECLPVGTWGHDGAYGTTVMVEPQSKLLFLMMIQRAGLNPYQDGLKFRQGFHAAVMREARIGR